MEEAVHKLYPGGRPPALLREAVKGWSQAYLLGQYYRKQVDVVISNWDRGAELIVSTKSMLSSYWNNLRNRFEEFVGDARNLRGRFPLASIGMLFVVRSTIFEEAGAFDFLVDMLRRLCAGDLYDTSCLVVVSWPDSESGTWTGTRSLDSLPQTLPAVEVLVDRVPKDISAETFLADLIGCVLTRTPITFHVHSRELRLGRALPVPEDPVSES